VARLRVLLYLAVASSLGTAQEFHPSIPRAWDDSGTTSFELPLAQADRSPRYPSAKEYYDMQVRPVYRTYPFYAPDKEPAGYWESLQQKEPEVVFDPARLQTKGDWIRAGELVFDQPIVIVPPTSRVGSDPGLAVETRRGTGFYKVPSLRGAWMRNAFGHEGQAASLEEWFDPARLNSDYVPKGFHLAPGPIQGHEFGIRIPAADRSVLVAFVKTL